MENRKEIGVSRVSGKLGFLNRVSNVHIFNQVCVLQDKAGTGVITVDQLRVGLREMGDDIDEKGALALLEALDMDHKGVIGHEEFIAAALDQRKALTAQTVAGMFGEDHATTFLALMPL